MRPTLCALALVAILSPARGADPKPSLSKDGFLITAMATSNSLKKFSELAVKKTEDKDLKDFASGLSEKATDCRDKLTKFANEAKIGLVAGPEKGRQAAYASMALKTGTDFDRAYLDQIIKDLEDGCMVMKKADKEENNKLKEIGSKGGKDCKAWLAKAQALKKTKFGAKPKPTGK